MRGRKCNCTRINERRLTKWNDHNGKDESRKPASRGLLTGFLIALLLAALPVAVWLDLTNLGEAALRRQAMEGERVVFTEENSPQQYVKLIATGEVDEILLDAIEDYVKRQKKRLEREAKL